MPRPLTQLPNTVTLDNATTNVVVLGGYTKLTASEQNKVIDLTKFSNKQIAGVPSEREKVWNAIAGAVAQGSLTIDSTSPALSPAFSYATVDGPLFGAKTTQENVLRPGLPDYTADTVRPSITGAVVGAGTLFIDVTFSEGIYKSTNPAGPVTASDFVLTFIDGAGTLTNVVLSGTATQVGGGALVGGETVIRLGLTPTGTAHATDQVSIAAGPGKIVDSKKNGAVEVALVVNTSA